MSFNRRLKYLSSFLAVAVFSAFYIFGCDDAGVETPTTKPNPNVKSYDSLIIEEDSAFGTSFGGINLLDGIDSISATDPNRDVSLGGGTNPQGTDFFLRSGILLNQLNAAGYETRFYRFYSDGGIDTVTVLQPGGILDSTDFTQEDTYGGVWDYFNVPQNTKPVYGFYLKGRKAAGMNNNIRVYGILTPIAAGDRVPGSPYGFWMAFKVRINIAGQDDFRKEIPSE
jgi:hypothetical protein